MPALINLDDFVFSQSPRNRKQKSYSQAVSSSEQAAVVEMIFWFSFSSALKIGKQKPGGSSLEKEKDIPSGKLPTCGLAQKGRRTLTGLNPSLLSGTDQNPKMVQICTQSKHTTPHLPKH